ncbi:MAG: SurA N-terminal domain-containing protein [Candidatus Kapabacteria bacterium]|nr:SurA N-terminal domain-containing protein [Candidatus Kapabacteria bacterium]MDW7997756.1 SurA N-terminal domain-containing protein [Bacteroidota bacterium]
MWRRWLWSVVLFPTVLWGQIREGQLLDRVVALVGGEVVFASDVEAQVQLFRQQLPPGIELADSLLRRRALETLIDERLMLLKAQEDSVVVSDDEVTQRLEFQLQLLLQQMGSERRVAEVYGMSLDQIRREYREEVRKRLLVEKLQQQRLGSVRCSAREVEEFFRQYRDSLPLVQRRQNWRIWCVLCSQTQPHSSRCSSWPSVYGTACSAAVISPNLYAGIVTTVALWQPEVILAG